MAREDDDLFFEDRQPENEDGITQQPDMQEDFQEPPAEDWSLMGVLNKLTIALSDGRSLPLIRGKIVDTDLCLRLIEAATQSLPEEMVQAHHVVATHKQMINEANTTLASAKQQAEQLLGDAHNRAQSEYVRLKNEAEEYSRQVQDSANAEAQRMTQSAQEEHARMMNDAKERVDIMMRQEEVYRMAENEAFNIKSKAQKEANGLYQSARSACMKLLDDMDKFLIDTQRDVRSHMRDLEPGDGGY